MLLQTPNSFVDFAAFVADVLDDLDGEGLGFVDYGYCSGLLIVRIGDRVGDWAGHPAGGWDPDNVSMRFNCPSAGAEDSKLLRGDI